MTIAELQDLCGVSRATAYRDIKHLAENGAPLVSNHVPGQAVRHRLIQSGFDRVSLEPVEIAVLILAREAIAPLDGTLLLEALDRLLRRLGVTRRTSPLTISPRSSRQPKGAVRAIDLAIREGHRLSFFYQVAGSDVPSRRRVDPVALRLHKRSAYAVAFDVERRDWRVFKLARITGDIDIVGKADPHPDYDERALFEHSVGIWTGEAISAVVRLSPAVAARASEYPLATGQRVERRADGSVIVRARVAGVVEAMRWTLAWGAAAEVLAPAALRDAVRQELVRAAEAYLRDDSEKKSAVSHAGETATADN